MRLFRLRRLAPCHRYVKARHVYELLMLVNLRKALARATLWASCQGWCGRQAPTSFIPCLAKNAAEAAERRIYCIKLIAERFVRSAVRHWKFSFTYRRRRQTRVSAHHRSIQREKMPNGTMGTITSEQARANLHVWSWWIDFDRQVCEELWLNVQSVTKALWMSSHALAQGWVDSCTAIVIQHRFSRTRTRLAWSGPLVVRINLSAAAVNDGTQLFFLCFQPFHCRTSKKSSVQVFSQFWSTQRFKSWQNVY